MALRFALIYLKYLWISRIALEKRKAESMRRWYQHFHYIDNCKQHQKIRKWERFVFSLKVNPYSALPWEPSLDPHNTIRRSNRSSWVGWSSIITLQEKTTILASHVSTTYTWDHPLDSNPSIPSHSPSLRWRPVGKLSNFDGNPKNPKRCRWIMNFWKIQNLFWFQFSPCFRESFSP